MLGARQIPSSSPPTARRRKSLMKTLERKQHSCMRTVFSGETKSLKQMEDQDPHLHPHLFPPAALHPSPQRWAERRLYCVPPPSPSQQSTAPNHRAPHAEGSPRRTRAQGGSLKGRRKGSGPNPIAGLHWLRRGFRWGRTATYCPDVSCALPDQELASLLPKAQPQNSRVRENM